MRKIAYLYLACVVTEATLSAIPIGSYTVNYNDGLETAPEDAKILITAGVLGGGPVLFETVEAFRIEIDISGLTEAQAAALVLEQVEEHGAGEANGPNSVMITEAELTVDGKEEERDIAKVDGSSNFASITLSLDGTVPKENIKPQSIWKLTLEMISPGYDEGDFELCPAGSCYVAHLPPRRTPEDAALILFNALSAAGFPDIRLNGSTITFLRSPSGEVIDTIERFAYTGSNVHIGLEMPAEVPEHSSAGLSLLGTVALIVIARRRSARPAPASKGGEPG